MKKTIEKIRQKSPQEKRRFAFVVSVILTAIIASISFLSLWWEINRSREMVKQQGPISVERRTVITEIKNSIEQMKSKTKANVTEAKDAL